MSATLADSALLDGDPFANSFIDAVGPAMASAVLDEFKTGWNAVAVMAKANQARIAAASERIERKAIDGVGECVMSLDQMVYHFWGQKLGYDCWRDATFRRRFLQDNPGARVRTKYAPRSNGWRKN